VEHDKSPAEMMASIGRALHPGLDAQALHEIWPSPLAADLGVGKETVRTWRRGRDALFDANHDAFDRLLELVERRAEETARARDELREWLRRNR
jgi:hypothetical protein